MFGTKYLYSDFRLKPQLVVVCQYVSSLRLILLEQVATGMCTFWSAKQFLFYWNIILCLPHFSHVTLRWSILNVVVFEWYVLQTLVTIVQSCHSCDILLWTNLVCLAYLMQKDRPFCLSSQWEASKKRHGIKVGWCLPKVIISSKPPTLTQVILAVHNLGWCNKEDYGSSSILMWCPGAGDQSAELSEHWLTHIVSHVFESLFLQFFISIYT